MERRLRRWGGGRSRRSSYAELLFEQAMLAEGGQLEDPAAFIARMNRLLVG